MAAVVHQSTLHSLPLLSRGKVRDNYALGSDRLLIVTSDRLSAFDVILSEPIPDKGRVLNRMALFWFEKLADVVPNHLTGVDPESVVAPDERAQVRDRSMVVKRLKPILVEAVVRGYLIGSGWNDYQASGAVCGIRLPAGLRLADRLPEPIFTPAAKAELGEHDENISFDEMSGRIGKELAERIREISLELYRRASAYARARAGLGWVPQERGVFASLTVDEHLGALARPGPWSPARVYELFPALASRSRAAQRSPSFAS